MYLCVRSIVEQIFSPMFMNSGNDFFDRTDAAVTHRQDDKAQDGHCSKVGISLIWMISAKLTTFQADRRNLGSSVAVHLQL